LTFCLSGDKLHRKSAARPGAGEKDEQERRQMKKTGERYIPLPYVALACAVIIGLIVFVRVFMMSLVYVMSDSMAPTMRTGDRAVAVTNLVTRGKLYRGEVVWFKDPRGGREALVKRVIALPGDRFRVQSGNVFVNGKKLDEPYIAEPVRYEMPEFVLPKGYIFVLGDNRNYSDDSRIWGPLPVGNVKGRVSYIMWPPVRVGKI